MVLIQKNVENWMHMHLCKNSTIEKRKWDLKIHELVSHFSKHVSNGEMKFYPAVRGLEDYILKNINQFNGTRQEWLRVKKTKKRQTNKILKNQTNPLRIKQYIMDAVDYYNESRKKYELEYELNLKNRKAKFDQTRQYAGH